MTKSEHVLFEKLPDKASYIDTGIMFNRFFPRYETICQSYDKHGEFACLYCTEFLGRMEYPFHCKVWRDVYPFTQPFIHWIIDAHNLTGKWEFCEDDFNIDNVIKHIEIKEEIEEKKEEQIQKKEEKCDNLSLFRRV